jgi:hypothetical protein
LERLSATGNGGYFRLSKGFFEYRETGRMETPEKRVRFQDALLAMAELADCLGTLLRKNG